MTGASEGLRKALVRGQKGSVLTLPEMSAEDLLAHMSDDQKTAIAAALAPTPTPAPAASASDDEDEDDMETEGDGEKKPKSKKKGTNMNDKESSANAGTQRALAVMASEHFAGREKLAATLLANEKLSADEITNILAASNPAAATPSSDDDDAKARADMRAKIAAEQPGELGDDDASVTASAAADWDAIHAEVAKDRGYATN